MASMTLSDVQTLNFTNLSVLRDAARQDLAGACCSFGLSRDQLRAIGELPLSEVLNLVLNAGNEALFLPRDDLGSLIAAHPAALPVLACVRQRVPARPSSEADTNF